MSGLVRFVMDRLAEDYDIAYGGAPSPWKLDPVSFGGYGGVRLIRDKHGDVTATAFYGGTAGHVLHFDPTQMIQRIMATRKIAEQAAAIIDSWEHVQDGVPGLAQWPDVSLRERNQAIERLQAIAETYVPGFRSEHPEPAQDARGCDLTGSEGETASESIRGSERNSAGRNEGDA